MFENTSNEMSQLLGEMGEVNTVADLELNSYEAVAYKRLRTQCEEFLAEAERLEANSR
jgi:hypothetical protein